MRVYALTAKIEHLFDRLSSIHSVLHHARKGGVRWENRLVQGRRRRRLRRLRRMHFVINVRALERNR